MSKEKTRISRRQFLQIGAIASAATVITACAPTASQPTAKPAEATKAPAANTPKRGGTLTYSWVKWPDLDPVKVATSLGPLCWIYDSLFRYECTDPKLGTHVLKGGLAESWDTSDPLKLVIKLRKGVKFHDGSDLTAEVVKWNIDRARTEQTSIVRSALTNIDSIDVVDPLTIRLNMKAPSPAILIALSQGQGPASNIISKAAFDKAPDQYSKAPVGTGPFVASEVVLDDHVTLKRNENYWMKDDKGQAMPYLDGVNFRIIRDPVIAYTELKAGTVDMVHSIETRSIKETEQNPDLVLYWIAAQMNFPSGIYGFNMANPLFKDKRVRQAFSYALDRKALCESAGAGTTTPAVAPWSPAHPGFDPAWNDMYKYDVAKAKKLLADAGMPDGFEARFMIDPVDRTGEVMQQMLAQAGIKIKIDPADAQAQTTRVQKKDWDIRIWNQGTLVDGALTWASLRNLLVDQNNYSNPDLEKLMNDGSSTFDEKVRAEKYKAGMNILLDEAVVLCMMARPNTVAYRKRIKGFSTQYFNIDIAKLWVES